MLPHAVSLAVRPSLPLVLQANNAALLAPLPRVHARTRASRAKSQSLARRFRMAEVLTIAASDQVPSRCFGPNLVLKYSFLCPLANFPRLIFPPDAASRTRKESSFSCVALYEGPNHLVPGSWPTSDGGSCPGVPLLCTFPSCRVLTKTETIR